MDSSANGMLISATASRSGESQTQLWSLHSLLPFLAFFVWVVEVKRRTHTDNMNVGRRLIRQLMPEMLGLLCLTAAIVSLLVCRAEPSLEGDASWQDVKREWPLLTTADSLIGMQAMLRVLFLLSASLRRSSAIASPLDGEPWAFFLLAGLSRVILLALSPRDVYHLDGPLGGDLNVALEVTALLLLLPLGCRILSKGIKRVVSFVFAVVFLAVLAKGNHFALSDGHSHLDVLFSLTFLLEVAAAPAFLFQCGQITAAPPQEGFTAFAHFMLPIQQALPSYFILVAFAPPFQVEASLVGNGRPFEILQACGLGQVALYIAATLLYTMSCAAEKQISVYAIPIPASEAPPADECVICLGSCDECDSCKPQWRKLQCGHHFHEKCIFEWLKKAQRCPVCRRDLGDSSELEA